MFGSQFYVQTMILSLVILRIQLGDPSSPWDIALSQVLSAYRLVTDR